MHSMVITATVQRSLFVTISIPPINYFQTATADALTRYDCDVHLRYLGRDAIAWRCVYLSLEPCIALEDPACAFKTKLPYRLKRRTSEVRAQVILCHPTSCIPRLAFTTWKAKADTARLRTLQELRCDVHTRLYCLALQVRCSTRLP